MSREEYVKDAVIDEVTNDHNILNWPLSEQLYDIVIKATNNDRNKRQQSITQLIDKWNKAK